MVRGRGKPPKHKRPDASGRNPHGARPKDRFVRLGHAMLNSNAYRALSPNARSLLVELAMLENGSNNGSLYLGVRDAADRLGVADVTAAQRAFDDLTALGFVTMTRDAHFRVKAADTSRARCWQLNWVGGPMPEYANAYTTREPAARTSARRRMERGLRALKRYRRARDGDKLPVQDFATFPPDGACRPAAPVQDFTTPNGMNGGNPRPAIVRLSVTYTADPWGQGGMNGEPERRHKSAPSGFDKIALCDLCDRLGAVGSAKVTYGAMSV